MIRVLVLDDDPDVRYGIYDYLKAGYEVYITKKEKEVYSILNQTNKQTYTTDDNIQSVK